MENYLAALSASASRRHHLDWRYPRVITQNQANQTAEVLPGAKRLSFGTPHALLAQVLPRHRRSVWPSGAGATGRPDPGQPPGDRNLARLEQVASRTHDHRQSSGGRSGRGARGGRCPPLDRTLFRRRRPHQPKTVDAFLPASDFFTLDVADWIGVDAGGEAVDRFIARSAAGGNIGRLLTRPVEVPGPCWPRRCESFWRRSARPAASMTASAGAKAGADRR